MSKKEAARTFDVPHATQIHKISGAKTSKHLEKHAENLTTARAAVSRESILKRFSDVDKTLTEDGMRDVSEHPECIFNADESGFTLCSKIGKVLGPRMRGDFYHQVPSYEKGQITAMECFSGSGETVLPMVIFPYE
ncbi:hypothetical protein PR048_017155 [Dryococelus australis]|uniref:Transposase n=1 Tax=Dryococelus australis TaxID=614101 RepID=A0ABQ9H8S5_9NEOP|nr:hypothetical protein PR048_017155 [Dryococelus australis]